MSIRIQYFVLFVLFLPLLALAQDSSSANRAVPAPDRKNIFQEDTKDFRRAREAKTREIIRADAGTSEEVDVSAKSVQYDKEKNEILGQGDVVISRQGVQFQADRAAVNTETKDANLQGNVTITGSQGTLTADQAKINMDSEIGTFANTDFVLEQGSYGISAKQADKLSEFQYKLEEVIFSTCHCPDGSKPWSVYCKNSDITQERYAHTYSTSFRVNDVPVLYSPYFAFPVKQERSSGLLIPEYSFSSEDGLGLKLPYFAVLNDHHDMTFAPFFETKSRQGLSVDYRGALAANHNINTRWLFSDESSRDGDLRGTVTEGLYDPTFDEERLGGFYKQIWRGDQSDDVPLSLVADVHYVGDDLFLRELEDEDIGPRDSRYTTSTIIGRATLGSIGLAELSGEYNQSLVSNDDLVFQRLPELNVSALRSFRPFGFNPYGLKLVTSAKLQATEFSREEGFDGLRTDLNPSVKIPFHFQNYLNSQVNFGYRQTSYSLDNNLFPDSNNALDSSTDRGLFNAGFGVGTSLERVYQLEDDNWLTYLTSLGIDNQANKLKRVKHTIDPFVNFVFVPQTEQDDLPIFDQLDRIRARTLFLYGVRSSVYGRSMPRALSSDPISELSTRIEELPVLDTDQALADLGYSENNFSNVFNAISYRRGEIRELASMGLKQAYDFKEASQDNDPLQSALSDLSADVALFPTTNFALRFDTNYNTQDTQVDSWGVASQITDDRGDLFRTRISYIDNSISQVEGNLEVVLSDRLKFGYYARYDDRESEFIETKGALRLASACNCWYVDFGFSDKINPDRQMFLLTFTLAGLGDVTQSFSFADRQQQ